MGVSGGGLYLVLVILLVLVGVLVLAVVGGIIESFIIAY